MATLAPRAALWQPQPRGPHYATKAAPEPY